MSDKIIFCLTKWYFVRQNHILLDKIIFCQTKSYFVRQNHILLDKNHILSNKIIFCLTKLYFVRQNHILLDKMIFCWNKTRFVLVPISAIQSVIVPTILTRAITAVLSTFERTAVIAPNDHMTYNEGMGQSIPAF